jgi:hypothetical protein
VAAPPGASQVSLCPIFGAKIYKEFSGIFLETFIFEDFLEIGVSIKTQKTMVKKILSKSKLIQQL